MRYKTVKTVMTAPGTGNGLQLTTRAMVGSAAGDQGHNTSSQLKGSSSAPPRRRKSPMAAGRYLAAASSLEPGLTQDPSGIHGGDVSLRNGDREVVSEHEVPGLLLASPPALRKKNMPEPAEEVKQKQPHSRTRGGHGRRGSFNSESGSQTADTSVASGSGTAATTPTDPKPVIDGSVPSSPSRQRRSTPSLQNKTSNFLGSAEKRRRTWEEQRQAENGVTESFPRHFGITNGKHTSPARSSVLAATKRWGGESSEASYRKPMGSSNVESSATVTTDVHGLEGASIKEKLPRTAPARCSFSLRRVGGELPCTNNLTEELPSHRSPLHTGTGNGTVVEEELLRPRQRQWTDLERTNGSKQREECKFSPRSPALANNRRTTSSPEHPKSPSQMKNSSVVSSSLSRHSSRVEIATVLSAQNTNNDLSNSLNRAPQNSVVPPPCPSSDSRCEPDAWRKALRRHTESSMSSPSNRQTPRATTQEDAFICGKLIVRQPSTGPDQRESRPRLQMHGVPAPGLDVEEETEVKTTTDIQTSPLTNVFANDAATISGASEVCSRPRGDRIRHLRTLFETKDSDDSRCSSMRLSRQTTRRGAETRSRSVGAISRRSGSRSTRELSLELGNSDDQQSLSGKSLSGKSMCTPYVEKLRNLNHIPTKHNTEICDNKGKTNLITGGDEDLRTDKNETSHRDDVTTEEIFVRRSIPVDEEKNSTQAMQSTRSSGDDVIPANAPGVKRLRSMFEQAKNPSSTDSVGETDSRDKTDSRTEGSVGGQRTSGDFSVHHRESSDVEKIGVVAALKSYTRLEGRDQTDSTARKSSLASLTQPTPPPVAKAERKAGCLRTGYRPDSGGSGRVGQRLTDEEKDSIPFIPGLFDDLKPTEERQSVAYQVALRESAGTLRACGARVSPGKATNQAKEVEARLKNEGSSNLPGGTSLRRTRGSQEHQGWDRRDTLRTQDAVQASPPRGSPNRSPEDSNQLRYARRRRRPSSKDEAPAESLREFQDSTRDLKPSGSSEGVDREVSSKSPTRQVGNSTLSVRALIASVERAPVLKGNPSRAPQSVPRDAVFTLKAAADRLARRGTPKLLAKRSDNYPEPAMSPRSGLSTSRHGNTVSSDAAAVFDLKGAHEDSVSPRSKSGNALASPSRIRSSGSGYAVWNDYGPKKSMGQRNSESATKEDHRFPIGLQQSNQEKDLRGESGTDSDDDEDGVTLSPTISDVSGITNPSGIESTSRRDMESDIDSSCDISSIGDEEAGHPKKKRQPSEVSLSQASEAAAPLFRSALGGSSRGRSRSSSESEVVDFANIDESGEVKRIRLLSRRQHDPRSIVNGNQQDYVEVVISGSVSGSESHSSTDSLFLLEDEGLAQQRGSGSQPRDGEWGDENLHAVLTTQRKKPFSWYMDSLDALMDAIKGGESNSRRIGRQHSTQDMARVLESSRKSESLRGEKRTEEIGLFEEIQSAGDKRDRSKHRRNRSQGPSRRSKIMGLMRRRKLNDGQIRDAGTCS